MHYATLWEQIADRLGDDVALIHGERRFSWRAFEERSARLAGALAAHGLGAGDGVAAYLYNGPECFEVFFGALKIRAVPSNVNYRYGSDELAALLENSGAKALVFDAALADRVAALSERRSDLLLVQVGGELEPGRPPAGALVYESVLASAEPAVRIERDPGDVFLSYTGGTTGLPKGVLFHIGQSAGNSLWFRDLFLEETTTLTPLERAAQLAAEDRRLVAIPASPLMHSTGFILASLPTLSAGGTVQTLEHRSFDPHELLRTVEVSGATIVAIVGDAFALPLVRALDEGRPEGGPYRTDTLRVLVSAGVAWSARVKARLLEHLPEVTLFDSCGSTEGVAYGISQIHRGDPVSTANFTAAPGLRVLGPDGESLPAGEVGLLAGPTTASGYFGDAPRTASVFFDVDGARHAVPGDLGRIEPDGTVTLIGRGVSTINTGGEKVYPGEVEEAIRTRREVDDCLVMGVPDERFGQGVAALVVRRPGEQLDAGAVVDAVRARLAGYKVPRRIRFVEAVPRLPNGKIDYGAASELAGTDAAD
jgi:acyl-CoA synthetase (AMP-forming)/AMP-acid ligase II